MQTPIAAARAAWSGSVKVSAAVGAMYGRPDDSAVPTDVDEVSSTALATPSVTAAPEARFSVFAHLDGRVSGAAADDLVATLRGQLEGPVLRRRDVLCADVPASQLDALAKRRGVAYVESGDPLDAPNPVPGDAGKKPPSTEERRVKEHASSHRYGRDVVIGIVDVGGFDFAHSDFSTGGDSPGTRWVRIWDQGQDSGRPSPAASGDERLAQFNYGAEIRGDHMNAAIAHARAQPDGLPAHVLEPQTQMQPGAHGTHVASIAAGNRGVCRKAHIAGVLIALTEEDTDRRQSFYDSTRIAHAIDYLMAVAEELAPDGEPPLPISINISLGTNGHAHDTSSAVARWIDYALATPGRIISVAAGNAGQVEPTSANDIGFIMGRVHAAGRVAATGLRHELEWTVVGNSMVDASENEMEVWYQPQDRIAVEIRPPGGDWKGPYAPGQSATNVQLDDTTFLSVYNDLYHPANGANRIALYLSPFYAVDDTEHVTNVIGVKAGGWKIRLTGLDIRDGSFDAWIERDDPRRLGPFGDREAWLFPSFFAEGSYTPDRTVSTLACAESVLSVANLAAHTATVNVTSSRGPTRDGRSKPDICAPGTDIAAANAFTPSQPWIEMSGTSMASPYVAGVAGLMLAIHPGLTAAQINGIVRRSVSPLPSHEYTWRTDAGFGSISAAACVEDTLRYRQASS